MGRLPSSQQIHQEFIWIWNNSYRTTSEQQQMAPNFQKGKTISLEWGRAKDKDTERDKGFQDGDLYPKRESFKRGTFSAYSETVLWMGMGRTLETCSEVQQRGLRGQNRKCITEIAAKQHFSAEKWLASLNLLQRLGLGSWGSGTGVRSQGEVCG